MTRVKLAAPKAFVRLFVPLFVSLLVLMVFVGRTDAAGSPDPASSGFSGFRAMVIGDVCNVRQEPTTESTALGQVTQGTLVEILDFRNDWARIQHKDLRGWMAGWLLDIDLQAQKIVAQITRTDVNLREGPGTHFGVKTTTQVNAQYPAEAKRGEWIRVALSGGDCAWVREDLLRLDWPGLEPSSPTPTSPTPGNLVVYPAQSSLAVRQSPVAGSDAVAWLQAEQPAHLVDCEGPWLFVETSRGVRGWAYGPSCQIVSPDHPSLFFAVSETSWAIGEYSGSTVMASDVNFRSGPGLDYSVIGTLQWGDTLQVLGTSGDWLKAISPNGKVGWVATYLTSGASGGASPRLSVTAEAVSGKRILTVVGPFANSVVVEPSGSNQVMVSTSSLLGVSAELPVNAYEFGSLRVSASDVTVLLTGGANYKVTEQQPGRVTLEFTPRVTSVNVRQQGASDVLTIETLGYALPNASRSGEGITLTVPGACCENGQVSAAPSVGQVIHSVSVMQRNGGTDVTVSAPGAASYLLKKTANTIEAQFGVAGLVGKRIIVDPGHETDDPGAVGLSGLLERDVNWEMATRLVALLVKAGADARLTRESLYIATPAPDGWSPKPSQYGGSLAKRAAWSEGADLFISIHNDHNDDRSVSGTTCYVCDDTLNIAESRRLAGLIQQDLTASIGTVARGTRSSGLYVVRESSCPAVLVEVMFLSNPVEMSYLSYPTTWDKTAAGLYRAIERYFGN